jgi:hypothetical protein
MITLESIQENYQNYDDKKIVELAMKPRGLRKDVIPILSNELTKRQLNPKLIKWVNYETNVFEGIERELLKHTITSSYCTECGVNTDLKGYHFHTKMSFLVQIVNESVDKIICQECAKKERIKSMTTTFFLGWWSRRGILSTPFVLIDDLSKLLSVKKQSELILNEFIDTHTGVLRIFMEKKSDLTSLIKVFNNGGKTKEQTDFLEFVHFLEIFH